VLLDPQASLLPAQAPDLFYFSHLLSLPPPKPSFPPFTMSTVLIYITPVCPALSSHHHSPGTSATELVTSLGITILCNTVIPEVCKQLLQLCIYLY
jgi:hypothetical protein